MFHFLVLLSVFDLNSNSFYLLGSLFPFSVFFGIKYFFITLFFYLLCLLFSYNSYFSGYFRVYNMHIYLITVYLQVINPTSSNISQILFTTPFGYCFLKSFQIVLSLTSIFPSLVCAVSTLPNTRKNFLSISRVLALYSTLLFSTLSLSLWTLSSISSSKREDWTPPGLLLTLQLGNSTKAISWTIIGLHLFLDT